MTIVCVAVFQLISTASALSYYCMGDVYELKLKALNCRERYLKAVREEIQQSSCRNSYYRDPPNSYDDLCEVTAKALEIAQRPAPIDRDTTLPAQLTRMSTLRSSENAAGRLKHYAIACSTRGIFAS